MLPFNLYKEDFFRGVFKPVNDELAKLFIRLDLMEQTGYGVQLVAEKYGKDVFEFLDFFLRVSLPFAYELENDDTQDDTQGDTQGDTQVKDLDTWIENEIRNNLKDINKELEKTSFAGAYAITTDLQTLLLS